MENLIKIGAAYGHHPVETLIEWGIIDSAWRSMPNIRAALKLAPEEWLADEVLERMLRGANTDSFTTPVDELAKRRRSNPEPLTDEELEDAVRDANARPRAAHPADDTEYTEPEFP